MDSRFRGNDKRLFLLFFISFLMVPSLFAEDVNVSSAFDKRAASVGEEIRLTIKIAGAQGNIQAPQIPAVKGMDTFYTGRSSRITFINGESSSSVEFSYILVARESGNFSVGPLDVAVGGKLFRTDPVQIEVTGQFSPQTRTPQPLTFSGYAPPSQPSGPVMDQPPPSFRPDDDRIFVTATVDKTSAYPNEQILLTYSLYTMYDTRYEGFQEEPEVSGFWIEEFPQDKEIPREVVRIDGKRYIKADIRKMALFPTAPAEYTIKAGSLKASIRQEPQSTSVFDEFFNDSFFSGGGFFSRREERVLKPPPIQITVKPFPEMGKPASFQGAVGNFRLSATIDKDSVKQDEPVTLTLVIEGEGNIETLNKPKLPEIPEFKIYEADTSSQLFKTGDVIGGRKTFEVVFIPIQSGRLKIPKLAFSYFNPRSVSYMVTQTPEFSLNVAPSDQPFQLPTSASQQQVLKKDIKLEAQDIRYIWEKPRPAWPEKILKIIVNGFWVLDGILTLFLLGGLFQRQQENRFAKDTALKRRRFAKVNAERKIRALKKLESPKDPQSVTPYFDEVEKILTQYLSDKFNVSAYGATRRDLESRLIEIMNHDDPLYQEVTGLYRLCEEARFAKAEVPEALKKKAVEILKRTITRVEKGKR